MPSASESFGLSALEAMACGIPCVTSNAGGLPEVNLDGETGFVCEVGDVEAMGNAGVRILKEEKLWKTFSDNAISRAQQFDIEKVVPLYEDYYKRVLQQAAIPTT